QSQLGPTEDLPLNSVAFHELVSSDDIPTIRSAERSVVQGWERFRYNSEIMSFGAQRLVEHTVDDQDDIAQVYEEAVKEVGMTSSLVATQPLYELRRPLGQGFGQYADAAVGHLAIPHLVADINDVGVHRLYCTTDLNHEVYYGDHRGQMTELDPTQLPG